MSYDCWGIKSKNKKQQQAIVALLNQKLDLVVLSGIAGSGKTLLAIAAGLELVMEKKAYEEIIFTRAPIAIGEDIGYLPGTEEEKMFPWAGGLIDNIEMLIDNSNLSSMHKQGMETIIRRKIKIKAMQYMRGRSLANKYVILDEVQNLSISQLKVLLSRAGKGTKIICLGDAEQIDNKRLNKNTNALGKLIAIEHEESFIKVIQLEKCERSKLAEWAATKL